MKLSEAIGVRTKHLEGVRMQDVEYVLALHSINGLGPIRLKLLLDYFQTPPKAWEANQKELLGIGIPKNIVEVLISTRKKLDPGSYAKDIEKSNIKWVTLFDDGYPKLLKEIYDPPVVLYYQGDIKVTNKKCVAVVGTRKITSYGRLVTEKFASSLAEVGLVIVSGLARGVDSLAHQATISVHGQTVAVLGGGLKRIFPPENQGLAKQISENYGVVISEFPPDLPSLPGNFPARNRIISGLSLGVLVTEAAEDSGSLITARSALEQGREVFAVPGPITSPTSFGVSLLIKQGASLVTEPEEILQELGMDQVKKDKLGIQSEVKLNDLEQKVVGYLSPEPKHVDEVCRELKLSVAEVSSTLVKLEIMGVVKNLGGGVYIVVR